jgi:hypothetical protein
MEEMDWDWSEPAGDVYLRSKVSIIEETAKMSEN